MKKAMLILLVIIFSVNTSFSEPKKIKNTSLFYVCYLYTPNGDVYRTMMLGYDWKKIKTGHSNDNKSNYSDIKTQYKCKKAFEYSIINKTLRISLYFDSDVRLKISNVLGQEIAQIEENNVSLVHNFNLAKYCLRKGIYFASITLSNGFTKTIKIAL